MPRIDINCDMGESTTLWQYDPQKDLLLLQYITSMNLACGYHAGDPQTMHELVEAAITAGVFIGAHPAFPDAANFGRTNMQFSPEQIYDIILYQVGALSAFLKVAGGRLHHVKPHGALYNMAANDEVIADAICKAVFDYDKNLVLYGLSGSKLIEQARGSGLNTCSEVFADRTYQDDGSLTPRSASNALIDNAAIVTQHIKNMMQQGIVVSLSGKEIPIVAETICIHGDGQQALEFARVVYEIVNNNP